MSNIFIGEVVFNIFKPKSEFSRNVLTLMTGTTIAQAIPIAISPILTRIYEPKDFGIFALYISIVSLLSIIVTARYEVAIVLPKDDTDAINILALSFIIMLIIVIISSIMILVFKDNILTLLNAKSVGNLLYLVPLSILLAGLNQIFNFWSNRKEYFKTISRAQMSQSLAIGTSQPILGYFSIYGGLILGNILGRLVSVFMYIDKFLKNDKELLNRVDKSVMIENMKKYKDFPLINSLHAFSDIIRTSFSVMLISSFFGATILGFYSLSLRVLQVPVGIIGSALGQVLYQKFTTLKNDNILIYPYAKEIFIKLIMIAIPLFVMLYFISPSLFAFVFGEKWRVAGEYSQILVPYLFFNFLTSPISQIPIILNRQKSFFYFSLIGNIGMPLIIFLGYICLLSINEILLIVSIFFTILYSYILFWILNITRIKE